MPQSVPTKYTQLLKKGAKAPVYIVEFEGLTTRYSNLLVKNPTGPVKPYLAGLSGSTGQITVDEGRSSIGSMTFKIIDKNSEITELNAFNVLQNRLVTIKTGFLEQPEIEYVNVFKGEVLDFSLSSDNITWKFQTLSLLKKQKSRIMTASTKLTAPIDDIVTTLPVIGTTQFAAATGGAPPQFYVKIEDEVISYTGVTATDFTGCVRGELGTVPVVHELEVETRNLVVLEGNGVDLALQIMTSTGLGTNGPFDVLPASAGLAIDESLIDVAKFISERQKWLLFFSFRFELSEAEEGKKFIESELFRFMNSYPIINNNGQISFKVYTPPLPTATTQEFTDANLVGAPVWTGNILARYFFNEVDLSFDFDFRTGEFVSRTFYEDSNSQVKYGQTKTLPLKSRGMRTSVTTLKIIDRFPLRVFKRFANPSPILRAKTFFSERLVEPGDVVRLTSSKIPNLQTGKRGVVAELVEVVRIAPNWTDGSQGLLLLNTGFSAGRKYAAISPSSAPPVNFPNFAAATPAEKNYAFISQEVSPTVGIMGDGSDGYYITP